MNIKKREQIRRTLRNLSESHNATMKLLEQMMTLINEELSLDAVAFWNLQGPSKAVRRPEGVPIVEREKLSVMYRGKRCFLGNTLLFRLLEFFVNRPNSYLTYQDLLNNVWEGPRSDSCVRSLVKRLRMQLRQHGMSELADAIDGSTPRRYVFRHRS